MKKLYFLLLFVVAICQAQNVSIPDNAFKSALLDASPQNQTAYGNGGYIKIDANNNGEIELLEAQAIDSLNVQWTHMSDITGIQAFTNLKKLDCSHNMITALDVSALTSLKWLDCEVNQLTSINIGTLSDLE